MPIVWTGPDGHESYMTLLDPNTGRTRDVVPAEGETKEQAVLRLALVEQAKVPWLSGATPSLIKTAEYPARRAARTSASAPAKPR